MTYLNVKNSIFLTKSDKEVYIYTTEDGNDKYVNPYAITLEAPSIVNEVPMYISVEEFKRILAIVRTEYSIREECIIRLMYQCGLRIGETLGLTADDVVIEKINGEYVSIAYIRNRVSDKKDQHAKTCMKVKDIKQYRTKDYNKKNNGFQTVIVPMDLYDLINEYIETTHVYARNNKHKKYYEKAIADRVHESTDDEDVNYYIFLNSQGTPLLSHLWNMTLREIFFKAGIQVDTGLRQNNLNHRFRHGYAMYQVKYRHTKILELMAKMRHRNPASVKCYYKPTTSDEIELKTQFTDDLYTIIPELKLT